MIGSTTVPMRGLIAGIGLLALACSDAPTSAPADLGGPQFAKKERPNFGPAITIEFADRPGDEIDPGDNIRSDGRSIYVDRECGVSATFNLEDARLDPNAGKIRPKDATSCGETRDARFVTVEYAERLAGTTGRTELDGTVKQATFMIVHSVETVMATGGESDPPVLRRATIHGAGCAHGLTFAGNDPQSNLVQVTNESGTPAGPWVVTTQPPSDGVRHDVAVCVPDEHDKNPLLRTFWHMPFSMRVTLKQ